MRPLFDHLLIHQIRARSGRLLSFDKREIATELNGGQPRKLQREESHGTLRNEVHTEITVGERTVAVIIRSEKSGGFNQGRYVPETNGYYESLGPGRRQWRCFPRRWPPGSPDPSGA